MAADHDPRFRTRFAEDFTYDTGAEFSPYLEELDKNHHYQRSGDTSDADSVKLPKANALAALGRNCPRIRTLNVSGNDGLKTLRGVEHMHALAALIAKECGIDDLSAVKGLKELNTLACAECEVRDVGDALTELQGAFVADACR